MEGFGTCSNRTGCWPLWWSCPRSPLPLTWGSPGLFLLDLFPVLTTLVRINITMLCCLHQQKHLLSVGVVAPLPLVMDSCCLSLWIGTLFGLLSELVPPECLWFQIHAFVSHFKRHFYSWVFFAGLCLRLVEQTHPESWEVMVWGLEGPKMSLFVWLILG